MDNPSLESKLDIGVLIEIARTVASPEAVAEAICAHAVAALGLVGANISLVRDDLGERRLESLAAVGQLSTFIRDASIPMAQLTGPGKTALDGEHVFVENPHGIEEDAAQATGLGRWRDGLQSNAYAVLGLSVIDGTIGVMTLEWPRPMAFSEADRRDLGLFADVAALVLRSALGAESTGAAPEGETVPSDDAEFAAFQANARGLVMPSAMAGSWEQPPVARVWTAVLPTPEGREWASFAEVIGQPTGVVFLAIGAISAGSTGAADEMVAVARGVIGAASAHGSSPSEILALLGSSMRSQSSGAWASGAVAAFYPTTGAVELAEGGSVALATLRAEGGFDLAALQGRTIDTERMPLPCRTLLTLPGDRIALLSGRVAVLTDPVNVAAVEHALAALTEVGGAETARRLLSLIRDHDVAAAVCILEVAAQPAEGQPAQGTAIAHAEPQA